MDVKAVRWLGSNEASRERTRHLDWVQIRMSTGAGSKASRLGTRSLRRARKLCVPQDPTYTYRFTDFSLVAIAPSVLVPRRKANQLPRRALSRRSGPLPPRRPVDQGRTCEDERHSDF